MATETGEARTDDETPTVLVVDDDEDLADTCAIWLRDEYDVRVAYDGQEALEAVGPDVDVVLLDRRMPDMPGDDVLERIRDEVYDCRVSMLTAVEPEPDIVEMPFDEYLVKPVRREDVLETVSELVARNQYDDDVKEYFALTSKLATLEAQLTEDELENCDAYDSVKERANALRAKAEAVLDDDVSFESAFREVDSP